MDTQVPLDSSCFKAGESPGAACPHSTENALKVFKALKGADKEVRRHYGRLGRGASGGAALTKKCQELYKSLWPLFMEETRAFGPNSPQCDSCWATIVGLLAGFHSSAYNTARALSLRVVDNVATLLQPHFGYFVGMFSKAGCEPGGNCIGPSLNSTSRYFNELYAPIRQYPFIHLQSAAINLNQPVISMDMYIRTKADLAHYPLRPKLAWLLFLLCCVQRMMRPDFVNSCSRTEHHNLALNLELLAKLDTTDIALLYCVDGAQFFMDTGDTLLHYQTAV